MFRRAEKKVSKEIDEKEFLRNPLYYFPSKISRENFLSIYTGMSVDKKRYFLRSMGFQEYKTPEQLDQMYYSKSITVEDRSTGDIMIFSEEDDDIINQDEVVLPRRRQINIFFIYPLNPSIMKSFETKNEKGFTRGELISFVRESYEEFYRYPQEYGLWGNIDMYDLFLTGIQQHDDTLTLDIVA